MNKRFRKSVMSLVLTGLVIIPGISMAETQQFQCSYTQASYTAPFMKSPGIRKCPENRCIYMISVMGAKASVNGVSGFAVTNTDTVIKLSRTAKDPVMGGMDTTMITINKGDMSFKAAKTTTPSVVLTTTGQCSAL